MMTTIHDGANMPDKVAVAQPGQAEATTSLPITDNERLRARIKQLEEERERDRQALNALQAERDAYRRAVYAWALEQITDEDVQRYAHSEEGLPLDDLLAELEQRDKASKDA
jgi:hypothetical protein